jgi:hypothetical protein
MAVLCKIPYIMLSETDPEVSGSVSGFRCNSGMLQIDFSATSYNLIIAICYDMHMWNPCAQSEEGTCHAEKDALATHTHKYTSYAHLDGLWLNEPGNHATRLFSSFYEREPLCC